MPLERIVKILLSAVIVVIAFSCGKASNQKAGKSTCVSGQIIEIKILDGVTLEANPVWSLIFSDTRNNIDSVCAEIEGGLFRLSKNDSIRVYHNLNHRIDSICTPYGVVKPIECIVFPHVLPPHLQDE